MARSKTTITKETRERMPGRGKSFRTRALNALREKSLLGLKEGATRCDAEQAFVELLVDKAISPEDGEDQKFWLNILISRGWAPLKQTSEPIVIEGFPESGSLLDKANAIVNAVAAGLMPVEIGASFVTALKATIDIETSTELKDQVEELKLALEKLLNDSKP